MCNDFGNDQTDDRAVYRVRTGEWHIQDSSDNSVRSYQFGLPGDVPL